MPEVTAVPLTSQNYQKFGRVLECGDTGYKEANQGRARRYNHVSEMINLRSDATLNMCLFNLMPSEGATFELSLLERHPYSTQVFFPMQPVERYLVVVAETNEETGLPIWSTLVAFIATGEQGFSFLSVDAINDNINFLFGVGNVDTIILLLYR
eukprot:TRINITY_DN1508_c0_g1_i1.p1 TRINITY_DN1508_c0_g1~~TRINITY_DN1508_c0_g1_i1.p1  ORF type:complete len:165 (+),score=24.67 TRINITY_DN1508_c0_g1_i1:36-497(+)